MSHVATIDRSSPEPVTPAGWRPRITHPGPEIDPPAARAAAADLLAALGMDLTDPDLAETPRRMAQALLEMTAPAEFELTTFLNEQDYDELQPLGVGVVIEAEHTCMSLRGARATGTRTTTSTLLGRVREDPVDRAEFLALTRRTR